MEIRDKRNGKWSWIYDTMTADPHLSATDKVVYSALATYSNCQEIHPSISNLSERSGGLSERTIQYSLRKLEDSGYITIEDGGGRGNASIYILLKAEKGCKLCTVSERVQNSALKGAKNGTERVHQVAPQHDNVTLQEHDNIYEMNYEADDDTLTPREVSRKRAKERGIDTSRTRPLLNWGVEKGLLKGNLAWQKRQMSHIAEMLAWGKTPDEIKDCWKWCENQEWIKSLDFGTVRSQIGKAPKSKPNREKEPFIPCGNCTNGWINDLEARTSKRCKCLENYEMSNLQPADKS